MWPDELIGLGNVRNIHVLPVEIQLLTGPEGHVAHEHEFRQRTGVVEVCTGPALAFTGIEPVAMMALNAGQALGGFLISPHFGLGDDARGPRPAPA